MKRSLVLLSAVLSFAAAWVHAADTRLLNVSYDPTREYFQDVDASFKAQWAKQTGQAIAITTSNGGSGKQARAVLDGLQADVVTLGLAYDIDVLADKGLLAKDWQTRLPDNSSPYTSTIVFLVRKGNPKHIRDWPDLIRADVQVITPNPKTSGGARWNFLAAWGWAVRQPGGNADKARAYVTALYQHVPVLDAGARGATNTFTQRGIGDVLIAWESEALLAQHEFGKDNYEIVLPSSTILAEPPVAVVDSVAVAHGTQKIAQAYLQYLYSPEGQAIAARHFFRPRLASVAVAYAAQFPAVKTFTLAEQFGDWRKAQATYFADGGVFDQITEGEH
ncbi:sulfate ABC transporter substrate-binding protein [Dyella mobilis]|uniref:Sulfate ABC transporter substrate-binding protein n=1 Tax=Dyella mobilis TaxID=1849582 RepID=A0ABS2KE30_9GAMM|nr:sulfate ABC transporter substrate-binding protein [Dyella mobilis]MBM7129115.1 sulfate ABC transporter substrate-binding protein [Dyella mobilis]GLQ98409.1 sulfate ABC transporter substrate-binding protein [Dyella mobilis]